MQDQRGAEHREKEFFRETRGCQASRNNDGQFVHGAIMSVFIPASILFMHPGAQPTSCMRHPGKAKAFALRLRANGHRKER
jgi:hypothetical protein